MKKVSPLNSWPESWRKSYEVDLKEVWGDFSSPGYTYAYLNRQQAILELVDSLNLHGAEILDVAAAQGNFALLLAEKGYHVTWNDIRSELAGYVRLKYEKGDITYTAGNILELNFKKTFDVVLLGEIIEHVACPDKFLTAISKLVKPNGYILMSTPNGGYFLNQLPKFSECVDPSVFENQQFKPDSDGHIFLLHTDELEGLAQKAGLRIIQTQLFNNFLTNGHIKTRYLLKIMPQSLIGNIEAASRSWPQILKNRILSQTLVLFRREPQVA